MSVPVIAFFNSKGGVGTTSLVYHLAWMFNDLGVKVLAVDLDPQADLTAAFLGANLGELLELTVYDWVRYRNSRPVVVDERLYLLPADLRLSDFEEALALEWHERALADHSALWRAIQQVASLTEPQLVLLDLGPNLSAVNRAGLLAADHVVIPLAGDLSSLLGVRNLGPALSRWRAEWAARSESKPAMNLELPEGRMRPLGYVVLSRPVRFDRPVNGSENWIIRIPGEYRTYVLSETSRGEVPIQDDPFNLAVLRPYPGLMSMAQEAGKPMFHLKPADGALGSYLQSAEEVRRAFEALSKAIVAKANLPVPLTT